MADEMAPQTLIEEADKYVRRMPQTAAKRELASRLERYRRAVESSPTPSADQAQALREQIQEVLLAARGGALTLRMRRPVGESE